MIISFAHRSTIFRERGHNEEQTFGIQKEKKRGANFVFSLLSPFLTQKKINHTNITKKYNCLAIKNCFK